MDGSWFVGHASGGKDCAGAAVHLDRNMTQCRQCGQPLAIGQRWQRPVGDDADHRAPGAGADLPDMQVGQLGVAVGFDQLADARGQCGVGSGVDERARTAAQHTKGPSAYHHRAEQRRRRVGPGQAEPGACRPARPAPAAKSAHRPAHAGRRRRSCGHGRRARHARGHRQAMKRACVRQRAPAPMRTAGSRPGRSPPPPLPAHRPPHAARATRASRRTPATRPPPAAPGRWCRRPAPRSSSRRRQSPRAPKRGPTSASPVPRRPVRPHAWPCARRRP